MALMQDPAVRAEAITASDSTEYIGIRAIYVGGDGDLAVTMRGNSAAVTFAGVVAGTVLPIRAVKIMSTNTTAANIVALF